MFFDNDVMIEMTCELRGTCNVDQPPTREMTRRFAVEIAHEHVGDGWVMRFIG